MRLCDGTAGGVRLSDSCLAVLGVFCLTDMEMEGNWDVLYVCFLYREIGSVLQGV